MPAKLSLGVIKPSRPCVPSLLPVIHDGYRFRGGFHGVVDDGTLLMVLCISSPNVVLQSHGAVLNQPFRYNFTTEKTEMRKNGENLKPVVVVAVQ